MSKHLYHCTQCGTAGADERKQDAFNCHNCGGAATMVYYGEAPEMVQTSDLIDNTAVFKNTVVLVKNNLAALEAALESGQDYSPYLYELKTAIEEL